MDDKLSQGAKNDQPAQVIRKHMPTALKGKVWNALIEAIATGDATNWDNAQKAFRQLFLATASGKYLERLAGDNGVSKPSTLGLGDDAYRELAIKTTAEKLTPEAFYNILEVFYGSPSVRAWSQSSAGPWVLQHGDTLFLALDGTRVPDVVFRAEDFQYIAHATAREVASVITRHLNLHRASGYAIDTLNDAGQHVVRIYSASRGLVSSVQILGGSSQTRFNFNQRLELTSPGALPGDVTWTLTTAPGQLVFQTTSNDINLFPLKEGDYVVVNGLVFDEANRGTFTVKEVNIFYSGGQLVKEFVVASTSGIAETVIPQTANDIVFYSPKRSTVQNGERIVNLSEAGDGVVITVPATTSAVVREDGSASYLHAGELMDVASLERLARVVTVTTTLPHGFSVGDNFIVDDAYMATGGGLNGQFSVASVVDSVSFTYESDVHANGVSADGATITRMAAETGTHLGPYILEPRALTVIDVGASISSDIHEGVSYSLLPVDDASGFPDQAGWVVIGYGTGTDSGPLKYLGRASPTALLLEFSPITTTNHTGASVSLVRTLPTEELDIPANAHLAYVTGSNLGLARLRAQLVNVSAAGVNTEVHVVYPGDRGLGGEGLPTSGPKVSDKVVVWGGDDIDEELDEARNE